jgi:hypothetical protein
MSRSFFDINLLETIKPQEVEGYLESHGWIQQNQIEDKASIWIQPCEDGDEFEVILPLRKELKGYSLSMSTLVETLEVAEQRPQVEILNDLTNYAADVLRVRVNTEKTINGRIPLNAGIKFSHAVKDLIISAAQATIKAEAYFERVTSQIDSYLENLQMGHEKGSYILDIISPISIPKTSQTALDFGKELSALPEPFERRIMKQLARSLQVVRNTAERVYSDEVDLDHFFAVVSEGVSANLCEAIVDIDKSGEYRGVDIKLSWSPILEIGTDFPTEIFIRRNIIPVIEAAATRLKSIYIENFELKGSVTDLHRLPDARTGKVIVRGNIEDKIKEVSIQLQDEDYKIAVQAHDQTAMIICYGELSKENSTFKLLNPRNISIDSN